MTMTVSKEIEFDAGHRVQDHASKCSSPHGHRYRVRIECSGEVQPEDGRSSGGMVVDFGDIKTILTTHVHDVLDHGFIVSTRDTELIERLDGLGWKLAFVDCAPTAENLAKVIYDNINRPIFHLGVTLQCVEVWETPTSMARYTP